MADDSAARAATARAARFAARGNRPPVDPHAPPAPAEAVPEPAPAPSDTPSQE